MCGLKSKCLARFLGCMALASFVSLPAWGAGPTASAAPGVPETAAPGTINYVEGQAKIGSETLGSQSVGKVVLQTGETLDTENGRVEVLLTPGVFLRVGQDTSVTMVSPSLTNTNVKVNAGEATVEVDEYYSENNLMVSMDDATTYLVHTGFYDFIPQQGLVRVIKGQAVVLRNDHHVRVNDGEQVELFPRTARLKTAKFDQRQYKNDDPLYSWSKLRSQYLAEANVNEAPYLYGWNDGRAEWWRPWGSGWWGPSGGWYGPGWYWDPWFMSYTFIPGVGVFYSPFGWTFYSPRRAPFAPYAVEGGRVRHFDGGFHSWATGGVEHPGAFHGPRAAHSFRGRGSAPAAHSGVFGGGFRAGRFGFHGSFSGRR